MARIQVIYPGAFLPSFGLYRFQVYIDDRLVAGPPGYLSPFEQEIELPAGSHKIEMRSINKVFGRRKSHYFNFDVPSEGGYSLLINISCAWGTWKRPQLSPE